MIRDPFNRNIHISDDGLVIQDEIGTIKFNPEDKKLIDLLKGSYKLARDPIIFARVDSKDFYRRWYGH